MPQSKTNLPQNFQILELIQIWILDKNPYSLWLKSAFPDSYTNLQTNLQILLIIPLFIRLLDTILDSCVPPLYNIIITLTLIIIFIGVCARGVSV